jgi:CRISPR-associated endonuclease/helicase Cas3
MKLGLDRFPEFLEAAHKHKPFPWQERLLARVAQRASLIENGAQAWPEAIALPTAAGKTTCIDIAVFALACQAVLSPGERTAPRRVFFVVDRRVIVDEAYEHAKALALNLFRAKNGVLKEVADALRSLNHDPSLPPLTCHQLRGGMYRDDAWARTPVQPCVIATTVDQMGSRLLFRTYGQSNKTWPIHAGLAANDALILLDEAHCANPFMQTVKAVARYRGALWAKEPLPAPFCFTIMSATPPAGVTDVFRLDMNQDGPDLRESPLLRRRIAARKPTLLAIASKAEKKKALSELAMEMATRAIELAQEGRTRIVIFANRVETARRVFGLFQSARHGSNEQGGASDQVRKLRTKLPEKYEALLLTGRMRPIDRDGLLAEWVPENSFDKGRRGLSEWFGTAEERPQLPHPVFVVSTQCLEVGANLDFDGIVSECASLDALRQRFGRVDRIGRHETACRGVILIRTDQIEPDKEDPVYGQAIGYTWKWLIEHAGSAGAKETPEVDFGVGSMHPRIARLAEDQLRKLTLASPDAPVMLPAHVDCWAQTAPTPEPDPDIALFLRGADTSAPEVRVCWRGDIQAEFPNDLKEAFRSGRSSGITATVTQFEEDVRDAVSLCPPTTAECLPVPLYVFRRWWLGEAPPDDLYQGISDLEAGFHKDQNDSDKEQRAIVALVWRGPEDSRLLRSVSDLRNGDTVVIPAALRGWEVFGGIGSNQEGGVGGTLDRFPATADVADVCRFRATRKPVLRLHPHLVETWPSTQERDDLLALLAAEYDQVDRSDILSGLAAIHDRNGLPDGLRDLVDALLLDRDARLTAHPFRGMVVQARRTGKRIGETDAAVTLPETFSHADDYASISTTTVELAEHCVNVGSLAAGWGELCGFPAKTVRSLRLAGEAHDLGKSDIRFQTFLHGGNRLRADLATKVYAKSGGLNDGFISTQVARRKSNLPDGFRHEQLSVALLEHIPELLDGECDSDLALHLVGSHHGRCRPLADIVIDDDPPDITLKLDSLKKDISADDRLKWIPLHRLDAGAAERFWRLIRRYGWWGLAWLEAVFILADHRQSEAESERSGNKRKRVGGGV